MAITEAKPMDSSAIEELTATILSGQTVSSAVRTNGCAVCSIRIPAIFTGTALTFQGSVFGNTYQPIYRDGSAYSVVVAAGKDISLPLDIFTGFNFLKIVSGSAEGQDDAILVRVRW